MITDRKPPYLGTMFPEQIEKMIKKNHHLWNLARKQQFYCIPHRSLIGADFSGHNLRFINLQCMDLRDASFVDSDLRDATLPYTFCQTNHEGALLDGAIFPAQIPPFCPRNGHEAYLEALGRMGCKLIKMGNGRVKLVTLKNSRFKPIARTGFRASLSRLEGPG